MLPGGGAAHIRGFVLISFLYSTFLAKIKALGREKADFSQVGPIKSSIRLMKEGGLRFNLEAPMGEGIYPALGGIRVAHRSSILAHKVADRPAVTLGRPAGSGTPHRGLRLALGRRLCGRRHQVLHQDAGAFRRSTPLRECRHFEDPYRTVERHGHDVTQPHRPAGTGDTLAIDPHMTGCCKRRGGSARAHHPRMPEPLVDTLAIQD